MIKTFKNLREAIAITPTQLTRLKKEYEPLRKIDMSKHKGQIEKTTVMLKRLSMGTLIDLSKEDIPVISDVAKSIVKKDKRFAHHVEEVEEMFSTRSLGLKGASKRSRERARAKEKEQQKSKKKEETEESLIVGLNKGSAEYKAGKAAAKKGIKYDDNPHAPGVKRLNWSTGHNDFRADNLRKAGKPNYGARGQFEELVKEADLTKAQIKMVHKQADELPKNDFIKRYGKDGDAVRYATATNQIKKKLGIED